MTGKKLTGLQRARLADPGTYAAIDAAHAAGEALFGPCMKAVMANLTTLLLAQKECCLTADEAAQVIALRTCFDILATKRQRFVEVDLAARLDPKGGGEMADD